MKGDTIHDKSVLTPLLSSGPLTDDTPYELKRAHELNAQLGPKGSQEAVDLLCDIHNTTSNMGLCLILYSADWIPLHILKHIQVIMVLAAFPPGWSHPPADPLSHTLHINETKCFGASLVCISSKL